MRRIHATLVAAIVLTGCLAASSAPAVAGSGALPSRQPTAAASDGCAGGLAIDAKQISAEESAGLRTEHPGVPPGKVLAGPYVEARPAASVQLSIMDAAGRPIPLSPSGPGAYAARHSGGHVEVRSGRTQLQVLMIAAPVAGPIRFGVKHRLLCRGGETLKIERISERPMLFAAKGPMRWPLAWVDRPWAFDAKGKVLPTQLTVEGDTIWQEVDATDASGSVSLDPTYHALVCNTSINYGDASTYLSLDAPVDGYYESVTYCPLFVPFAARNGYWPVFGYETNIASDYGLIVLRQDGGCTNSPDTDPYFDFQVPCKAHDYCYDLRKAGYPVSDSDCDQTFLALMAAHCDDRVLEPACLGTAAAYFEAVRQWWVITYGDPARVYIDSANSRKCLEIHGASMADDAQVWQNWCYGRRVGADT
jgi:hypothetical protein